MTFFLLLKHAYPVSAGFRGSELDFQPCIRVILVEGLPNYLLCISFSLYTVWRSTLCTLINLLLLIKKNYGAERESNQGHVVSLVVGLSPMLILI